MTNLFDDQEAPKETNNVVFDNEKIEDEEESEENDNFFPFRVEEEYLVTELIKLVRGIISENNLSPYQLRQIAVVIYALEHLPHYVEGISIGLGIVYRLNNESSFCEFYISESEFRLTSGGNTYDPGIGSDSYSSTIFELETSGYRDGDSESYEVTGWFNQVQELLNMEAEIEFEDNGDDSEIDWNADPNGNGWEKLYELSNK